jgi:hypothetical protein
MATVLDRPKESIAGATPARKKTAPKDIINESYVIYSIYYTDEPDGGYVVYSSTQTGWAFSGYLPAKKPTPITEFAKDRFDINLL